MKRKQHKDRFKRVGKNKQERKTKDKKKSKEENLSGSGKEESDKEWSPAMDRKKSTRGQGSSSIYKY